MGMMCRYLLCDQLHDYPFEQPIPIHLIRYPGLRKFETTYIQFSLGDSGYLLHPSQNHSLRFLIILQLILLNPDHEILDRCRGD